MSPFTQDPQRSVSAWGESRLIEGIRRWLGKTNPPAPAGIGDDCAVVATGPRTLITVDPVVHGRHFDDSLPARAVGAKLLKRNASDIAAMGGRPTHGVVSLVLPADVSISWIRGFYLGLAAAARAHGVSVVGGDVTQGAALSASLTLLGRPGPRVLTRKGARPGDHLFVTGVLGGSRLGWHHRFQPRIAAGHWLARQRDVRALMDVSDGLSKDLRSLTPPRLLPALRPEAVPLSAAARRLAKSSGRSALEHALSDGEDFELVWVVDGRTDPTSFLRRWPKRLGVSASWIGTFVHERRFPADALNPFVWKGYEHLRET